MATNSQPCSTSRLSKVMPDTSNGDPCSVPPVAATISSEVQREVIVAPHSVRPERRPKAVVEGRPSTSPPDQVRGLRSGRTDLFARHLSRRAFPGHGHIVERKHLVSYNLS